MTRKGHRHTKQVLDRLARIEGHVRSIRSMVEEGRDCSEVLIQIAAVRSALQSLGRLVLEDHFETCLLNALREGQPEEALETFREALTKFVS